MSPDGHPGRAAYQQLLVERGEKWILKAVDALAAKGVNASSTVLIGESFAESLIAFAEERNSDLIVVGGARDGFFGGHAIGPVSQALLHHSPIPVALAPRGYAEDPPDAVGAVTAAVPTRPGPDNPLPFAITLASSASLPIRTATLLSAENLSEAGDVAELRRIQLAASEDICSVATRALPDAPQIECLVADGLTLESALKKLKWDADDLLVVGSSRFAAPRRVFLGSTAARILAGTDAPAVVIPRDEE